MRRAKKSAGTRYIDSRIAQLKSDRDLSKNPADVMWYNRTMQELNLQVDRKDNPRQARDIAREFLVRSGLIPAGTRAGR